MARCPIDGGALVARSRELPRARVDVIVNRRASRLRGDTETLRSLARAAEGRARIHETRSLDELDQVARELAQRGTDTVILAGGDGSYMAGTTALHGAFGASMPRVAFAPGGTVGTVARNWGMRGAPAAYATRLVEAVARGGARVRERPTLCVTAGGTRRIGFIFGAGLVASFFDAYYAGGELGYAAAARIVAEVFAGSFFGGALASRVLEPVPMTLSVDDATVPAPRWSLVAASVVKDLGLHMRLLYRAAERRDRFHAVASALPARALGPQLFRVLAGRRLRGRDHVDTLARVLELAFPDPGGSFVLDGDVFATNRVRVESGPTLAYVSA